MPRLCAATTGICPMKARASSENTNTVTRHRPTTLSWRATVMPAVSWPQRLAPVGACWTLGSVTIMSAATTNRYVAAFPAKIHAGPTNEYRTPPMTGPMTREAFIWAEFSEMAPGRSCLPTSPGRTAEYAGPNIALPAPTPSTITTSRTFDGWGEDATRATPSENTSCSMDKMMRKRLRSILSARRPPTMGRIRVGPSWAKMMTPTNVAECVRSYAYAPRTTFCIHVPMLEAKAPKKTMRNVRCDSAARAVPDRAGRGVSPSTTASSISSMEMELSSPPDADPDPEFTSGRASSDEGGTNPSYGRPSTPLLARSQQGTN